MEIIIGRKGTQKMPISDMTVSREHCKVTDAGDGTYIVENLSESGTLVNGVAIIKKTVKRDDRLQLGPKFVATLGQLLGPEAQAPAKQRGETSASRPEVKTYNIAPLRRVWEDFNQTNIALANARRTTNLTRTGMGIFTMCTFPMIYFFGPIGYALTAVGLAGNLYSFVGMKNEETPEERQSRQDAFDDAWVCPNPACRRSLPARNYKLLVKIYQSCPHCKCRYEER